MGKAKIQRIGPSRALILFVFLLSAVTSGCATVKPPQPGQYIIVYKEGYPVDPNEQPLHSNDFERQYIRPILRDIDTQVKKAWKDNQVPRVLLFVHGGLNSYGAGFERIKQLTDAQKEGTYPQLASSHLLFIGWNSSLLSSVWDDLFIIRRGELSPVGGPLTAPFVLAARLGSSLLTAPLTWWFQGDNAVDSTNAVSYFVSLPVRMPTAAILILKIAFSAGLRETAGDP